MKASALPTKERSMIPTRNESLSPRYSPVPTVDQVMVEERAASFGKRSIKTSAKLAGLKMAVSMCDLTTLEGKDTPGKVAYLCRKALQPIEAKYDVPSCAAVCVYPNMVKYARKFLGDPFLAREHLRCRRHRISQWPISAPHQARRSPPHRGRWRG